MTIRSVTDAQIVVATSAMGFDISAFTGQIEEVPGSVGTADVTTFADGGYTVPTPVLKSGKYRFAGYSDYTVTTGINRNILETDLGSTFAVMACLPATSTVAVGDHAEFGTGLLTSIIPFSADLKAAGATGFGFDTNSRFVTRGFVGATLTSRSTSYTGTAVAVTGPSAVQRMYGLVVVSVAAGTNLIVKLQSDDNVGFASPTDRVTFSTMSAAGYTSNYVAGDLSTETHWRITATVGSGSFTWGAWFGLAN